MAKTVSWVAGVILVIAGVWGFFAQPAVGFIAADVASSVIHVLAGLLLVVLANKPTAAMALKVVGVVYVLWAILGFLNVSPTLIDTVTTWFYLVVGIVVGAIGFTSKPSAASTAPQM